MNIEKFKNIEFFCAQYNPKIMHAKEVQLHLNFYLTYSEIGYVPN